MNTIENLNGALLGGVLGSLFVAIVLVTIGALIILFLLKQGISYSFKLIHKINILPCMYTCNIGYKKQCRR